MSERTLEPNEVIDILSASSGARHRLTLHVGFKEPRSWEGGYRVERHVQDYNRPDGTSLTSDCVHVIVRERDDENKFIRCPWNDKEFHLEVEGIFRVGDVTLRELSRVVDP